MLISWLCFNHFCSSCTSKPRQCNHSTAITRWCMLVIAPPPAFSRRILRKGKGGWASSSALSHGNLEQRTCPKGLVEDSQGLRSTQLGASPGAQRDNVLGQGS